MEPRGFEERLDNGEGRGENVLNIENTYDIDLFWACSELSQVGCCL